MASGQSNLAVWGSVAAGTAITVVKLLAAIFGGSAAMLAEGIHSVIDTSNSLLLYLGLRRAHHPPDESHPFGYGKEVYFWSLVVAMVMFAVGGGVTITEGVSRLLQPTRPHALIWSYSVLAISFVCNSFSWGMALKEFLAGKGDVSVWKGLKKAKDPTVLIVLFEDTASLVGLALAFLGLFLADRLDMPILDGIASVLIGVLMGTVAVGLVYQCKTLLIGESVNKELQESIRDDITGDDAVQEVRNLLTMHLGPQDVLLNMEVRFRDGLTTNDLAGAVARLQQTLRDQHPEVKRAFIQPCL